MSFASDVFVPIIKGLVYFGLVIFIVAIVYFYLKREMPKWRAILRYKVFRKPYLESDIIWTIKAIDKGWNKIKIIKKMLVKGNSDFKIATICMIYDEIQRKMKREVLK